MTVGAGVTVTPVARHASRPDQRKSGAYPKATASQLAQLRLERQERLLGERNIHLRAVIDEAALHRQVGGTQVMREQISKLIELNEQLRAAGLSPAASVALMARIQTAL